MRSLRKAKENQKSKSRGGAAVDFHLPQPVLGVDETLGEEQIVAVGGGDVGYAPFVAADGACR